MVLRRFLRTWKGALSENQWHRWVEAGLAIAVLLLTSTVTTQDRVVVPVPPTLGAPGVDGGTAMGSDWAEGGIKEAWALFIAHLIGNTTPESAEFIADRLGTFIAPQIYSQIRETLLAEAKRLKDNRLSVQYSPDEVVRSPESDLIAVKGTAILRGGEQVRRQPRTYEMRLSWQGYYPQITHFDVYKKKPQRGGQ